MLTKVGRSTAKHLALEGGGSGDNLDELGGDSGLAGSVVLQVELVQHLAGVLGGVLHGAHAGGLLGGGVVHQHLVQLGGHGVLVEVLQGLGVVLGLHLVVEEEGVGGVQQGGDGLHGGDVHDGGLELVVQEVHGVVLTANNILGKRSGELKSVRHLAISGGTNESGSVRAAELGTALLTEDENIDALAIGVQSGDSASGHTSEDGVHATAKTLVGCQNNKQVLAREGGNINSLEVLLIASDGVGPRLGKQKK